MTHPLYQRLLELEAEDREAYKDLNLAIDNRSIASASLVAGRRAYEELNLCEVCHTNPVPSPLLLACVECLDKANDQAFASIETR